MWWPRAAPSAPRPAPDWRGTRTRWRRACETTRTPSSPPCCRHAARGRHCRWRARDRRVGRYAGDGGIRGAPLDLVLAEVDLIAVAVRDTIRQLHGLRDADRQRVIVERDLAYAGSHGHSRRIAVAARRDGDRRAPDFSANTTPFCVTMRRWDRSCSTTRMASRCRSRGNDRAELDRLVDGNCIRRRVSAICAEPALLLR
jgi:hypothetical protein